MKAKILQLWSATNPLLDLSSARPIHPDEMPVRIFLRDLAELNEKKRLRDNATCKDCAYFRDVKSELTSNQQGTCRHDPVTCDGWPPTPLDGWCRQIKIKEDD